MTNPVLLHNLEHKNLRVIRERSAAFGDNVMSCIAFPAEFRDLQAHYPIVFARGADGAGFEARALLGFEEGENLFLGPRGWDAHYVPMAIERQPFLIGRSADEMLIHIDLDSPRVSTTDGEPLFLPYGGASDYLNDINATLRSIHDGVQNLPHFMDALSGEALLRPFVVALPGLRLEGFYTIDEEKLNGLPAETLERLSRAGYLHAIYMAIASLSNFQSLIARKQAHA